MEAAEIECQVESLAYGAAGVARTDQGVVLVNGVVPGDLVRAKIVATHRDWREAEVVEVLEPSPARREPPCVYVRECGGCPWQQVEHGAQLAEKERLLASELRRGARLEPGSYELRPILATPEWGYRHRVNLRVAGEAKLGFFRAKTHSLVEIERCLIADDDVNAHLPIARCWLAGASTDVRRLEIAAAGEGRAVFVANAEGHFRHDEAYHRRFLEGHPSVLGIVVFGKGWRRVFGEPRVRTEVEPGLVLETSGGFTQVSRDGNRLLVETVLGLAEPTANDRVLDLFCGGGNLTIPLARRAASVTGVDFAGPGIQDARRSADALGLANCRFLQQAAGDAAKGLAAENERFSLVVLDPPRSGALEVVPHLSALAEDRLVYVSCDPPTLARDLRRLGELGFRVEVVQPIDLFPQTYHLETVVRLCRA